MEINKFKIFLLLSVVVCFIKNAYSQDFNTSICGVEYKIKYSTDRVDSITTIRSSVLICNNSKANIYIPTHLNFYILSETYFIQKLGVLFKDIKDNPTTTESLLAVRLLKKGDSVMYSQSCITPIVPKEIKKLMVSIDFIFEYELKKKDFALFHSNTIDGNKMIVADNTFLISLKKYRSNAIWINNYLTPVVLSVK